MIEPRPLPYVTESEGQAKVVAQARYLAALGLIPPNARPAVEQYVELLERDLLADFERWARLHEREIQAESVVKTWVSRPSGVGYIELAHLRHPAAIREAIADVLSRGATSIVIDLRDVPGGSVEQTALVGSEFIAAGPCLQEVSATTGRRVVNVTGSGVAIDPAIRVVVLLSRFTSSGGEAIAAALHHHRRATLVGETTFGKTWIWHRLSDGSERKTADWLTPAGVLCRSGVAPDVQVEDRRTDDSDPVLERALELLA